MKIKKKKEEGEKLYKYCNESFNKVKSNYHTIEKESLAIMRGVENFLIFFPLNLFLISISYNGILGFIKKNLSNMQVQMRLL